MSIRQFRRCLTSVLARCHSTTSSEHLVAFGFGSMPSRHLHPSILVPIRSPGIPECKYPRPSANGTFFRLSVGRRQNPSTRPDSEPWDETVRGDVLQPDEGVSAAAGVSIPLLDRGVPRRIYRHSSPRG